MPTGEHGGDGQGGGGDERNSPQRPVALFGPGTPANATLQNLAGILGFGSAVAAPTQPAPQQPLPAQTQMSVAFAASMNNMMQNMDAAGMQRLQQAMDQEIARRLV